MKARILFFVVALIPLYLAAQSAILSAPSVSKGIPTDLDMALGKGDVDAISGFLADKVEMTLLDETETVMKNAAIERLSEFYETNPPRGYHIKSVVDGTRESGELVTLNGNFKVNITYLDTKQKKVTTLGIGEVEATSSL